MELVNYFLIDYIIGHIIEYIIDLLIDFLMIYTKHTRMNFDLM